MMGDASRLEEVHLPTQQSRDGKTTGRGFGFLQ